MSEPVPAKVPEDKCKDVYYSVQFIKESYEFFKQADTNKNLFISLDELKAAVKKRDPKATDDKITKVFKSMDFDDNKKISFDEFLVFDFAYDAYALDYYNALLV